MPHLRVGHAFFRDYYWAVPAGWVVPGVVVDVPDDAGAAVGGWVGVEGLGMVGFA